MPTATRGALAPLALALTVSSCSVDDRALDVLSGGTGGGGVREPGDASNADSGASTGGQGGSSSAMGGSANAGSGGTGAADAGVPDSGLPAPSCGSSGGACCADAPRCGVGLGCDVAAALCTPCSAFHGVGIVEGYLSSTVNGISGDGQIVVGQSEDGAGNTMAFRRVWAAAEGPIPLGVLPGGVSSSAIAASYDGFAVVGVSGSANGDRGFRWASGSLVNLGTWASGDLSSQAADISADGNVVVLTSVAADNSTLAYRWLLGGDTTPIIGMEEARAVSADGNVLVGNRLGGTGNEPVITTPSGLSGLGALAGDSVAFARGLSADGSTAVGVSGSCGCRGFRWRAGTLVSTEGLFRALDTSADGSIVVGDSVDTTCSGGKAAIWSAGPGKRAVACDSIPAGLIPNGWSLTIVTAVSDDGRVIAGEGINPALATEGWVAVLGPDCRAP